MGTLLVMLILFGLSIYFWVMVVNGSARRKANEPSYAFWRMKGQDREDADALSLAFFLVAALVSSLGAIVILVFVIVGWFKR